MKNNILYIIVLVLLSNTLIADNNMHQVLGITVPNHSKQIIVSETKRKYREPKKNISQNSQIDKLMKYTKVKKTSQKNRAYGLKMGYNISKILSVSIDILAQVDIQKSEIKSQEANFQFALSL